MIKVLISIKKILQKNKYNNLMMDLEKDIIKFYS